MAFYWGKDFHLTKDTAHNSTWDEEGDIDKLFLLTNSKVLDPQSLDTLIQGATGL